MQTVVFGIPTLSKTISVETYQSMMALQWALFGEGVPLAQVIVGGDPYLSKVRNKIATLFLDDYPQATDLFFIDDDVGFPHEAALRLIASDKDVIAGIYPKKEDGDTLQWPTDLLVDKETKRLIRDGDLYLASHVPTGFLRIKRHVLERMAVESDKFKDRAADGREIDCYNIFEMGYCKDDGKWWGEDYAFCQRWRNMGGEVWVDPNIPFTHRGGKTWAGTFNDAVANYEASVDRPMMTINKLPEFTKQLAAEAAE